MHQGQATLSAASRPEHLRAVIESLQHLRLAEAAKHLHMSMSKLKGLCRTIGIKRWRYVLKRPDDGNGQAADTPVRDVAMTFADQPGTARGTAPTSTQRPEAFATGHASSLARESFVDTAARQQRSGSCNMHGLQAATNRHTDLPALSSWSSLPALWSPEPVSNSSPALGGSNLCGVYGQAHPQQPQSSASPSPGPIAGRQPGAATSRLVGRSPELPPCVDPGKLRILELELRIDTLKAAIESRKCGAAASEPRPPAAAELPLSVGKLRILELQLQIDKLKASIASWKPWADVANLPLFHLLGNQAYFDNLAAQAPMPQQNYTPGPTLGLQSAAVPITSSALQLGARHAIIYQPESW